MKKLLLVTLAAGSLASTAMYAETVTTGGKTYEITTLIDRDLGPGVRYTRLRLPDYPLNVNMLRIDVTNPYNSMEVTQASDKLYGTESLVTAAKRQSSEGHKALAGANANFWCVASQPPYSDQLIGVTYNGNIRNGKTITEINIHADQYNRGLAHTGVVAITEDKKVFSSNSWYMQSFASNPKIGRQEIYQVNKVVRPGELCMYNSYYGTTRTFRCVDQAAGTDGKQHWTVVNNCATEVYLKMDAGQEWKTSTDLTFTVNEVKTNAGGGTLGSYDLALVGRDAQATELAKLAIGDKVTLNNYVLDTQCSPVAVRNMIGGNAQVMMNGEMTSASTTETYNSQVYSRTCYGADKDNKTLYIIVIDKSTDPVYGSSAGCSVTVACDIAKLYGCVNMTNFDAGGSAEMFVKDAIINKTTEGTPRAVANGMFAYDIAPTDNTIARLEFDDVQLQAPIFSSCTPRVLGYNKYGSLINENVTGFTLSCPAEAGSCQGDTYTAAGTPGKWTLTATLNGVSVTKDLTVLTATPAIRVKPTILIDATRKYPVEVTATVDRNTYTYNPATVGWTIADSKVASIGADGVLQGIANGTTTLTANVGGLTDQTEVRVEIAPESHVAPCPEFNTTTWKFATTGVKVNSSEAAGTRGGFNVNYNITSTRGTKLSLSPNTGVDVPFYSLPDAFEMVLNPGNATVTSIEAKLQPANSDREVSVKLTPTLTANADNTVTWDMSQFGDPTDLSFYPVSLRGFNMYLGGSTATGLKLNVASMQGVYRNFGTGVESIENGTEANGPAALYNLQGVRVDAAKAAPGIYISRQGSRTTKVVIR